jgi:NAD(P) transhydrogenase
LGVQVAVVDTQPRLLEFCDREIVDQLMRRAQALGITFRLGERVVEILTLPPDRVVVTFDHGQRLMGESVLYAAGRQGNTESLNLMAAGVRPDENGRLWCNEAHQTWAKHIYGVGDVVGFPSLASVSMEQGSRAVCHAFGQTFLPSKQLPYGLFTIPEVAMIGPTEEQLSADKVPYEVGVARYGDVARGHLVGNPDGLLKLLFHRDTHQLVAVHIVGESANELIHIGQTVISFGGTIEYFRDAVFNYPSLAECYKVATLDGLTNLDRLAPESLALVASDNESIFDDDEASEEDSAYLSHSASFRLKGAR